MTGTKQSLITQAVQHINELTSLAQVTSAANGYAIANFARQLDKNMVVIADDVAKAQQLFAEVQYFLNKHTHTESNISCLLFNDREILPYDNLSPPADLISHRLKVLSQWRNAPRSILVVAASTALYRLPPTHFLTARQFSFKVGDKLSSASFSENLITSGYHRVPLVREPGEFALRGGIIDVFPTGSSQPFRLDLFDDEIETIRLFDLDTQRSTENKSDINLLPTNEFILNKESCQQFLKAFTAYFIDTNKATPKHSIYQSIKACQNFPGIENYLPFFHEKQLSTLAQYVTGDSICLLTEGVNSAFKRFYENCEKLYTEQSANDSPVIEVEQLFVKGKELTQQFSKRLLLQQDAVTAKDSHCLKLLPLSSCINNLENAATLLDKIRQLVQYASQQKLQLFFSINNPRRKEQIERQLVHLKVSWTVEVNDDSTDVKIIFSPLKNGFVDLNSESVFCSEVDLFGRSQSIQSVQEAVKKRTNSLEQTLSVAQLKENDPIVHIEHGIGLFKGLQTMEIDGWRYDVIKISYNNSSILYLPVEKIHLIDRYIGNKDSLELDALGNKQWKKRTSKVAKQLQDVAADLLKIYADRERHTREPSQIKEDYFTFCEQFPFTETEDQLRATNDILQDMQGERPMDRLICGDVGFGKTEVAMRAAFLTVSMGLQVAILVPTTVLAHQHSQSFRDRFSEWPVSIDMVSRARPNTEIKKVLQSTLEGKVDILIGTQRLLQKDVDFKKLGLLIIDEEHRFGVRQKENLKKMRSQVDIVSMTATPIPRTLNMAFSKLRDMSIISTPPVGRISIQSFITEWSDSTAIQAIHRELNRGGQIYFVHNSIKTIEHRRLEIQALVPEAKIEVAHGQMPVRTIEGIIDAFSYGQFDILLCTTIIETGLDIPNVNTILIDRADKFGLAQLHQLRGRVGRSHHQAYAYFFAPIKELMTSNAYKRLTAIGDAQGLGSGFKLAIEDLEIRGAGEILGEEQKGHIQRIGLNLYINMLNRTINQLSDNSSTDKTNESSAEVDMLVEVDIGQSMLLPEEYIEDIPTRLSFYQRIATCNIEATQQLRLELLDRYGKLPIEAENLLCRQHLRVLCGKYGIKELTKTADGWKILFLENHRLNMDKIIGCLQKFPESWQLKDSNSLVIKQLWIDNINQDNLIKQIEQLFLQLS